ncbi:hypothetical protein [Micromonospora sp. NPDC000668]|uniref:hypothetical protein n=1 Tax=Micromonospora sp. NPDC000668 TaxID=3364219 RepID=UPI0036785305
MNPHGYEEVTVEQVDQRWLDIVLPLVQSELPTLTLLPQRIENGATIYDAQLLHAAKTLRANGVDAQFVSGERGRLYQSNFSATGALLLGVLLNLASSAAWDGIKYFTSMLRTQLKTSRASTQKVVIAMGITKNADGSSTTWQRIEGPADLALERVEAIVRAAAESSPGAAGVIPPPRETGEGETNSRD